MSYRPSPFLLSLASLIIFCATGIAVRLHLQAARPRPNMNNLRSYLFELNATQVPQFVAYRNEINDGPAALAREIALAKAAGIPTTLAQVQPPMPPQGQNAAPIYRQIESLEANKNVPMAPYMDFMTTDYSYTRGQIAGAQAFVASRSTYFRLLHKAASMPKYVSLFDRTTPDAYFADLDGGVLRESSRNLATESFLLAKQGHYGAAANDQILVFHIARQATSDSSVIGHLVGLAIEAMGLRGMTNTLYIAGPNAAADSAVENALTDNPPELMLQYDMEGAVGREVPYMSWIKLNAKSLSSDTLPVDGDDAPNLLWFQVPMARKWIDASTALYLSKMIPMIAVANQPDAIRRPVFAVNSHAGDPNYPSPNGLDPVAALYGGLMFNDYAGVLQKDDTITALWQVDRAAAAVLAAKARLGNFPAQLPANFTDPFNGKELGYRREGKNGFVVYSVGASGTFDGGKPGQYTFRAAPVFFRYPGPPLKPVPTDMLKAYD